MIRRAALAVALSLCTGTASMADDDPAVPALAGHWALEAIDGTPFEATAEIEIDATGALRGTGPCNGFGARLGIDLPAVTMGAIRATKRACPDLAAENVFLGALQQVEQAAVEGETLLLTTPGGTVLSFRAKAR